MTLSLVMILTMLHDLDMEPTTVQGQWLVQLQSLMHHILLLKTLQLQETWT
jgi:hypothetical protein